MLFSKYRQNRLIQIWTQLKSLRLANTKFVCLTFVINNDNPTIGDQLLRTHDNV